jgi:hypothetical protein
VRELLRRLQERNDALRARLGTSRGRLVMEFVDLEETPPIDVTVGELPYETDWAIRNFRAWSSAPFPRGALPLARALLAERLGVTWLHLLVDQMVCDGWSLAVMTDEVDAVWRWVTEGGDEPPRPGSFREYLAAQARGRSPEAVARYRDHWRGVLGADSALPMPRHGREGFQRLNFVVPTALSVGLPGLRERLRTTDFCVLTSLLATVLGRRCGRDSVVVHTHISERHEPSTLSTVGFLVNYVALRVDVGPAFEDTVRSCRMSLLEAMQHQVGPFHEVLPPPSPEGATIAVEPHGYAGDTWNAWGKDCRKPDSSQARMAVGDESDWTLVRSAPLALGDVALHYKPAAWGYILALLFNLDVLSEEEARDLAAELLRVLGSEIGTAAARA